MQKTESTEKLRSTFVQKKVAYKMLVKLRPHCFFPSWMKKLMLPFGRIPNDDFAIKIRKRIDRKIL